MSNDSIAPLPEAEAVAEGQKKTPKAFSDLNKAELVVAADFFGADPTGNVKEIRAELLELGVTWDMYVSEFLSGHGEAASAFDDAVDDFEGVEETVTQETVVQTAPAVPMLAAEKKYLVKFVGENQYFERGKYKFTPENPYAVMPANDAQNALVEEPKKFRQAYPNELQEFYS